MIYFIQAQSGPIKIGYTTDGITLSKRMESLQTAHYEKLHLLFVAEGEKAQEFEIHRLFRKFRVRGEWFSPAVPLINFIMKLTEDDGGLLESIYRLGKLEKEARLARLRAVAVQEPKTISNPIEHIGTERLFQVCELILSGVAFTVRNFSGNGNILAPEEVKGLRKWLVNEGYVYTDGRNRATFNERGMAWLEEFVNGHRNVS